MTLEAYIAFCLAAIAIVIVPGPTVTVVIANSLKYGQRAGLLNVAGTQAGLVVWMAVAILGLASAITFMGVWFDVIRIVGAGYLVWLGIKLVRSKGEILSASASAARRLFSAGFRRHPVQPEGASGLRRAHPAIHFTEWRLYKSAPAVGRDLHGGRDGVR